MIREFFGFPKRESRSTLIGEPWHWLSELGVRTKTGDAVTAENALQISSVYACVRLLSETIASLPLYVYSKEKKGKNAAEDHNLFYILHDKPNNYQTSFEFREMMMGHVLLRGNAYAFIEKNQRGQVTQLVPLNPIRMVVKKVDNRLVYEYSREGAEKETFSQDEILHFKGLSNDGIVGLSPVALAREAFGLTMAAENYGSRFFANAARPSGVLSHPQTLKPEAQKKLKESWTQAFTGEGTMGIAVLEEGMSWETISVSNDDAQFLELRQFQVAEIARIFRVPPHMIADLSRATFSNIEEQSIEFVTYSLRPWLVRLEQSMNTQLFNRLDRGKYFAEHKIEGLLRGNTQSRFQAYAVARNCGWLNVNEIREFENMNPVKDGDIYLVPTNMQKVEDLDKPKPQPVVGAGGFTGQEGDGNADTDTQKE
jgi:HK97 family phage portal protein